MVTFQALSSWSSTPCMVQAGSHSSGPLEVLCFGDTGFAQRPLGTSSAAQLRKGRVKGNESEQGRLNNWGHRSSGNPPSGKKSVRLQISA